MYVGKYKLLKTIGKGNFAKVKLAKHMPTGQEVRARIPFSDAHNPIPISARILISVPSPIFPDITITPITVGI